MAQTDSDISDLNRALDMAPVLTLRMRLHRVENEMGERGLYGELKVESETLKFAAVGGINDPVNSSWSRWTPAATMQIMISNPAAIGKLARGEEFIVDIREAPGRISSR